MNRLVHFHATASREPGRGVEHRPALVPMGLSPSIIEIPMVYQNQPGVLPHTWKRGDGTTAVDVAADWDAPNVDVHRIAERFGVWARDRWAKFVGYVCLNIESIPLNTKQAAEFWRIVLASLRAECPGVKWGFYDRPDLFDLVDFNAPSVYANKFVRPDRELIMPNEHEMGISEYRRRVAERLREFPRGKPMLIFAATKILGGEDAGGWCSRYELLAQMEAAQTHGADGVVWWMSFRDAVDYRRHIRLVNWAAAATQVSTA